MLCRVAFNPKIVCNHYLHASKRCEFVLWKSTEALGNTYVQRTNVTEYIQGVSKLVSELLSEQNFMSKLVSELPDYEFCFRNANQKNSLNNSHS